MANRYQCPNCGEGQNLDIAVSTWARLIQHDDGELETDTSEAHEHEWNDDSGMACRKCAFVGKVADFDSQSRQFDPSELATILAALRMFQEKYEDADAERVYADWCGQFTADDGTMLAPLGTEDIDDLCARLRKRGAQ